MTEITKLEDILYKQFEIIANNTLQRYWFLCPHCKSFYPQHFWISIRKTTYAYPVTLKLTRLTNDLDFVEKNKKKEIEETYEGMTHIIDYEYEDELRITDDMRKEDIDFDTYSPLCEYMEYPSAWRWIIARKINKQVEIRIGEEAKYNYSEILLEKLEKAIKKARENGLIKEVKKIKAPSSL